MNPASIGQTAEDRSATPADVSDYSPRNFYTWASDKKGHSHQTRVNLPKDWGPIMARLVELVPAYEFSTEFVRDACFHRARWLSEHLDDPELNHMLAEAKIRQEVEQAVALRDRRVKFLDNAKAYLDACSQDGDDNGRDSMVAQLRAFAATAPQFFATKALALIARY